MLPRALAIAMDRAVGRRNFAVVAVVVGAGGGGGGGGGQPALSKLTIKTTRRLRTGPPSRPSVRATAVCCRRLAAGLDGLWLLLSY